MTKNGKDGDNSMGRREFLTSVVALGAVSAAGCAQSPMMAQAAAQLPARGEFVVRDAYVLSMDPKVGDHPRGDVHVRGGKLVSMNEDRVVREAAEAALGLQKRAGWP